MLVRTRMLFSPYSDLRFGMFGIFILVNVFEFTHTLTGHVCSRQKAETYQTTYDRAFICPERYTTACGQLDWRRCTKYRVNTCYTPTQKYAMRYYTVEECCPGWRDSGGGVCTIPMCADGCENGGSCGVATNGIPGCTCQENFYGTRCQYGRHTIQKIIFLVLLCFGITALFAVALHFYCRSLHKRTVAQELLHLKRLDLNDTEKLLQDTDECHDEQMDRDEEIKSPSAPVKE